ncbi:zf-HC2 domain-containing protein [Ideonella sp.]|uniref:zf-HC2 domain-containing protein n=1 Tax=Ideonella sp. TaxID=1929293 RepID=UPI0037C08469
MLLRASDVQLTLGQKMQVRLHLMMCGACTNFSKQVKVMNGAMGPWRAYRNDEERADP